MKQWIADYADGYLLLNEVLKGIDEEELNFKPDEKSWSIKEVILHICDTEIVAVHRIKQVISEDEPLLTAFNQDLWANRLQYTTLNPKLNLELFGLLRESMLPIFEELSEEDWKRTGTHNEVGVLSLSDLVRKFVQHVQDHLHQIDRIKQIYRNSH